MTKSIAFEFNLNPVLQGLYKWGDPLKTRVEVQTDGSAIIYQGDQKITVDSLGFFRDVTKVFDLAIRAMPHSDLSSDLLLMSCGTSRACPDCDWS